MDARGRGLRIPPPNRKENEMKNKYMVLYQESTGVKTQMVIVATASCYMTGEYGFATKYKAIAAARQQLAKRAAALDALEATLPKPKGK